MFGIWHPIVCESSPTDASPATRRSRTHNRFGSPSALPMSAACPRFALNEVVANAIATDSLTACASAQVRTASAGIRPSSRDYAFGMAGEFGVLHARWRTWLRVHTPNLLYYGLGIAIPKAGDCANHEWYNVDGEREACYHCLAERPRRRRPD